MSLIFLKRLSVLFIAPALLLTFAATDNSNFSGDWTLNEGKSDMGQFANFVPRKIKVDQKADAITIAKTSSGFNGEEVIQTETLTFDGKEVESTVFGNSKRKAKAEWSADGKTLTITFKLTLDFNDQITEVNGTEKLTLGDDGKSMTLQSNSSSSFGENPYKGVYEK